MRDPAHPCAASPSLANHGVVVAAAILGACVGPQPVELVADTRSEHLAILRALNRGEGTQLADVDPGRALFDASDGPIAIIDLGLPFADLFGEQLDRGAVNLVDGTDPRDRALPGRLRVYEPGQPPSDALPS